MEECAHLNDPRSSSSAHALPHSHLLSSQSYPLGDSDQQLLCRVEEDMGNLHVQQADPGGALTWYQRAVRSTESLLEGVEDEATIAQRTRDAGECEYL